MYNPYTKLRSVKYSKNHIGTHFSHGVVGKIWIFPALRLNYVFVCLFIVDHCCYMLNMPSGREQYELKRHLRSFHLEHLELLVCFCCSVYFKDNGNIPCLLTLQSYKSVVSSPVVLVSAILSSGKPRQVRIKTMTFWFVVYGSLVGQCYTGGYDSCFVHNK